MSPEVVTDTPASTRRRRRWPIITAVIVVLVLIVGTAGVGWYYSTVLLTPDLTPDYPDQVAASADGEVTLVRSHLTEQPGTWGLVWAGGRAVVGPIASSDDKQVVRPVVEGTAPPAGTAVYVDTGVYGPDPASRGLPFNDVSVRTPLGDAPAWFVPGTSDTWVVAVHGREVTRRETLRIMPVLHKLGYPVLSVTYRNDAGAPASPDGYYHLGDTEWQDVEAAVDYATSHGARKVVLYAWSMGGAITGAFLDRSSRASVLSAVVWDAPVIDWKAVLGLQSSNRHLPGFLGTVAAWFTTWRIGIDFSKFDLVTHPPAIRPPTLLFHGDADSTVPIQPARDLAAAAPGDNWPLQFVEVHDAEHTASWNVDPAAYEAKVTAFLSQRAPTG